MHVFNIRQIKISNLVVHVTLSDDEINLLVENSLWSSDVIAWQQVWDGLR